MNESIHKYKLILTDYNDVPNRKSTQYKTEACLNLCQGYGVLPIFLFSYYLFSVLLIPSNWFCSSNIVTNKIYEDEHSPTSSSIVFHIFDELPHLTCMVHLLHVLSLFVPQPSVANCTAPSKEQVYALLFRQVLHCSHVIVLIGIIGWIKNRVE